MNILIINWRSIKDPLSGGAEIATFETAKIWTKKHGAKVFWISPKYKKEINNETIKDIKFIYLGMPFSKSLLSFTFQFLWFYLAVIFCYFQHFRGRVDVVIDQIHGIPYLAPLYVKETTVAFIHEIAGDIWDHQFPFPINFLGKTLEKVLLRFFYQKTIFVARSWSTKTDLIRLGLPSKNIKIVSSGVSMPLTNKIVKEEQFTVIFLNRLVKMKGTERAIKVFDLLRKKLPEAKMWIVGQADKEYQKKLENLCQELKIKNSVIFFGFVPEEKKIDLLSRAHVLINTSYKEGFGMVNIEANRRGTPVVAFDVAGNRDSIKHGINGYLIENDNLNTMVKALLRVKEQKETLQKSAWNYSKNFKWEKRADEFLAILKKAQEND